MKSVECSPAAALLFFFCSSFLTITIAFLFSTKLCLSYFYIQLSELLYLESWKGPDFEIVSCFHCFCFVFVSVFFFFKLKLYKACGLNRINF